MTGHDHDLQAEMYGECATCALREGAAARDAAMFHVEQSADPDWIRRAREQVRAVAVERADFTTDDVWARLPPIDEPRAMGAIMGWAVEHAIVERTDTTRPTTRPEAHARPVRVWRSLIHRPAGLFD